jgi:hypothetical protein
MKTYWGVVVELHAFLISPLDWDVFLYFHNFRSCFPSLLFTTVTKTCVGIAQLVWRLGYVLDDQGLPPGRGWESFCPPSRPDRLWGPPSHLSNGYQGLSLPGGKRGRGVKLTTHLHLVLRSRMRGDIPPLPQYVFMPWCLVKHRDNFAFYWEREGGVYFMRESASSLFHLTSLNIKWCSRL